MKIKDGFILKEILSESIVLDISDSGMCLHNMLRLNDEAAFAFRLLQDGITQEQLVSALLEKYPADAQETRADVAQFLRTLREAGVLEE